MPPDHDSDLRAYLRSFDRDSENPMPRECKDCRAHGEIDDACERHEVQIEQLRTGQEALRLALAEERAAREAADTRVSNAAHGRISALEGRVKDCEAVTQPWRSVLINVGTAMTVLAFAWAKWKGWI